MFTSLILLYLAGAHVNAVLTIDNYQWDQTQHSTHSAQTVNGFEG